MGRGLCGTDADGEAILDLVEDAVALVEGMNDKVCAAAVHTLADLVDQGLSFVGLHGLDLLCGTAHLTACLDDADGPDAGVQSGFDIVDGIADGDDRLPRIDAKHHGGLCDQPWCGWHRCLAGDVVDRYGLIGLESLCLGLLEHSLSEWFGFGGGGGDQDTSLLPFLDGGGDVWEELGVVGDARKLALEEFIGEFLVVGLVGEGLVLFSPLFCDGWKMEEMFDVKGFWECMRDVGLFEGQKDLVSLKEFNESLGEAQTPVIKDRSFKIKDHRLYRATVRALVKKFHLRILFA